MRDGWREYQTVSPGLRPRPSLSAARGSPTRFRVRVSPGLRPRPSLSAAKVRGLLSDCACVAGVTAPAFVERRLASAVASASGRVSPGLRPRPSLSVDELL